MNDFESKWQHLRSQGHAGGRYRVYPDHPLDIFLDYSAAGRREVIIEAQGQFLDVSDIPSFENLEVSVLQVNGGTRIVMTLNDEDLARSFSIMCFDIAERARTGESVEAALAIALDCIRNWADLLKRRGKAGLSRTEAIGLWGEVATLKSILLDTSGFEISAVRGWRGPNGDQRDIGFNGTRIEVKSQLSTRATSLRISSLDQLDDRGDRLKVVLNRISPAESGFSLRELIDMVSVFLVRHPIALSEFERKVELSGYLPDSFTSQEKFGLDERVVYSVEREFPRLTPATVPAGIRSAEYEIVGSMISNFQIDWQKLLECFDEANCG